MNTYIGLCVGKCFHCDEPYDNFNSQCQQCNAYIILCMKCKQGGNTEKQDNTEKKVLSIKGETHEEAEDIQQEDDDDDDDDGCIPLCRACKNNDKNGDKQYHHKNANANTTVHVKGRKKRRKNKGKKL